MKFALLAALTTLVWSTSALVTPTVTTGIELTERVPNFLDGEKPDSNFHRSLIAPGDSNAERLARGLAPKAPAGIYRKKATKTVGGTSPTASPPALAAYQADGTPLGALWRANDGRHVTISRTEGFAFLVNLQNAETDQTIQIYTQAGTGNLYIAGIPQPAGASVGQGHYISLGYVEVTDNGSPENFCYVQKVNYETSNWGWGGGSPSAATFQWFDPTDTIDLNFYVGNDGYVHGALAAADVTNQSPPLTEASRIFLEWFQD